MILRVTFIVALALVFTHCSHQKENTAQAEKSLQDRYEPKVGSATKNELVEEFGNPEWCKVEPSGSETCRFYHKKGTVWIGDKDNKRDKKPVEEFDQVIADFDGNGTLRSFKSSAQRAKQN